MAYDERPENEGEAQRAWDYFYMKYCHYNSRYEIRRMVFENGKWAVTLSASCWMFDGKKESATPEEVNNG